MSDSEEDSLPISQMVANKRKKRNTTAPKKKKQPPKKIKVLPERPANARRSRRLQPAVEEQEEPVEEKPKKKAPAKKKKTVVDKKSDGVVVLRKTRSTRRTTRAAAKEEAEQDHEESFQDESNKKHEEVVDAKEDSASNDVAAKQSEAKDDDATAPFKTEPKKDTDANVADSLKTTSQKDTAHSINVDEEDSLPEETKQKQVGSDVHAKQGLKSNKNVESNKQASKDDSEKEVDSTVAAEKKDLSKKIPEVKGLGGSTKDSDEKKDSTVTDVETKGTFDEKMKEQDSPNEPSNVADAGVDMDIDEQVREVASTETKADDAVGTMNNQRPLGGTEDAVNAKATVDKEQLPIKETKADVTKPPVDSTVAKESGETAMNVDEADSQVEKPAAKVDASVARSKDPAKQVTTSKKKDNSPSPKASQRKDSQVMVAAAAGNENVLMTDADDGEPSSYQTDDEIATKDASESTSSAVPLVQVPNKDIVGSVADKLKDKKEGAPAESHDAGKGDKAADTVAKVASPLDLLANVADTNASMLDQAKVTTPVGIEPRSITKMKSSPLDLLAAVADKDADGTVTVNSKKPANEDVGSRTNKAPQEENIAAKGGTVEPSVVQTPSKVLDNTVDVDTVDDSSGGLKETPSVEEAKQGNKVMCDTSKVHQGADVVMPSVPKARAASGLVSITDPDEQRKGNKQETTSKNKDTEASHADEPAELQTERKEQTQIVKATSTRKPAAAAADVTAEVLSLRSESVSAIGKSTECGSVGVEMEVAKPRTVLAVTTEDSRQKQPPVNTGMIPSDISGGNDSIPASASNDTPSIKFGVPLVDVATTIDAVLVGTTGFAQPPDPSMLDASKVVVAADGVGGAAKAMTSPSKRMQGPEKTPTSTKTAVAPKNTSAAIEAVLVPDKTSASAEVVTVPEKTPAMGTMRTEATVVTEENETRPEAQSERISVAKKAQVESKVNSEMAPPLKPSATTLLHPRVTDNAGPETKETVPFKLDDRVESSASETKESGASPMEIDASIEKVPKRKQSFQTPGPENSATEIDSVPGAAKKDVTKDDSSQTAEKVKTAASVDRTGSIVPVYKPPTPEETAALFDSFPGMTKEEGPLKSRPKKRRRNHLSIRISGIQSSSENEKSDAKEPVTALGSAVGPRQGSETTSTTGIALLTKASRVEMDYDEVSSQYERDLEDSLAFFSETHEEQDPAYMELQHEKDESRLKEELANIKQEYEDGVSRINEIVSSQLKERQAHIEKKLPRLVSDQSQEEQKDLQRLKEVYVQKLKSHNTKLNEGIQRMITHHNQEMQKAHAQHRQQAQQRGISEQVASAEWGPLAQRLQAKQQQELKQFNTSGDDVKKTVEAEYQREKEKYVAHHDKKRKDLEEKVRKGVAHIRGQFQQQQQRYVKALALRLRSKREELRSLLAGLTQGNQPSAAAAVEDNKETTMKIELRSPSPVTMHIASTLDEKYDSSGAASRSKHRKGILSAVHKQLSVEIHNEGLWISVLPEKGDESKKDDHAVNSDRNKSEFIPWSNKARSILQSIICGEIPFGYGADHFDFGDAVAVQGGHIRCVVIDLRTSEETASVQRAAGMKKQEADSLKALEERVEKLGQTVAQAEMHSGKAAAEEKQILAYHEKTMKEVEKANETIKHLRNKFKNLLGPDDMPLPTLNSADTRKLTNAFTKCNSHLETAQSRLKVAETALYEKKSRSQKMMTLVKQANKAATAAATSLKKKRAQMSDAKSNRSRARLSEAMETERASTRIADVIGALQKTAEARREQLDCKRSSAASSTYAQSLPDLPNALKKSLWHKMHHRRQQIVLRPNMEFFLSDLKETVEAEVYAKERASRKHSMTEDVSLRAEQLFLLAAFPEQGSEPPPLMPPSNSHTAWAEPGWKINLEVPDESGASGSLLPRVPVSSIMQKNHSEFSSAPGRQVASLMKTTHLQSLSTPLSATGQAISLAETSPVANGIKLSESDPFNVTDVSISTGYTFALRSSPSRSSSHSRKRTTPKLPVEEPAAPPPVPPTPPMPRPKPKPSPTPAEVQAQVPSAPSPAKRSTSTGARRSPPKTDKPLPPAAKPKRSRSKSSTGASPRKKSKQSLEASAASAAAADAAQQVRNLNFMQQQQQQQQVAANAIYGQHHASAVSAMDQQVAQYSPSYMKQMAQNQANLQGLPPPQLQQTMAAQQQQMLSQPPYGSPQQFQQRQFAQQMRLMQQQQQQQQQSRASFSQQQAANMQFFNPAAMQAAAAARQSYGAQQGPPPPIPLPGQQHRTASGEQDNRNDPLFMLPDMPPPPPPP